MFGMSSVFLHLWPVVKSLMRSCLFLQSLRARSKVEIKLRKIALLRAGDLVIKELLLLNIEEVVQ